MPSTKCIELVEKRLSMFCLCLETDIVSIVTDGASVMTKVLKLVADTGPAQQLCFAHGLQLAVLDVLYAHGKRSNGKELLSVEHMSAYTTETTVVTS